MNVGISLPLPPPVPRGRRLHVPEGGGARLESFWCAEHPFIPVPTRTRSPEGIIPESYSHFIDPFIAFARASGVTKRVKQMGTGLARTAEAVLA